MMLLAWPQALLVWPQALLAWPLVLMVQAAPVPQTVPAGQAAPVAPNVVAPSAPRVQASVVLVHSFVGGLHVQQGSGVVIAPGLVATNAHVARDNQGLVVRQGAATWIVTQVRMDPAHDLCLLTVPGLTAPAAIPAPEPDGPGQAVLAVGYPGGRGPVLSRGRLRGIWHHGTGRLLQSDATTLPGSSGGGLFDAEGRLLGLTTMTFTPSPRLNFSVPVAWIQEMAARPEATDVQTPVANLTDRDSDLLEHLARDPRNWPAWEVAARQWVEDLPGDANAWLALGFAMDRATRAKAEAGLGTPVAALEEEVAVYRRALSLRKTAKTWNNLGVTLDLLNRFEEAEAAFSQALELEPGYALAWLNLGSARINAGRFEAAIAAYRAGLALRPDEADAWARLGHCQRMAGQRDAAVQTFQLALKYRPLAADLWLDLGQLLVELSRKEEAEQVQAKLAVLNPELAARLQGVIGRLRSGRSPSAAASGKRGR